VALVMEMWCWSWGCGAGHGDVALVIGSVKRTFRVVPCHGNGDNGRLEWRCVTGSVITDVSSDAVLWGQ
jgi:hypothetical protein